MALRTINYSVTATDISPKTVQSGGIQGESNATNVIFTLSTELVTALTTEACDTYTLGYRVDATDGSGGYHPSDLLVINLVNNTITYALSQEITSIYGVCKLQLIISLLNSENVEEQILFSSVALIKIYASSFASSAEIAVKHEITGALQSAVAAKTAADTAAQTATQKATESSGYSASANTSQNACSVYVATATTKASEASDFATAASQSATAAATSETNAATGATNAGVSAIASEAFATNSATFASSAEIFATNATTSATSAVTSETNAAADATNARVSATAATVSAADASTYASAAATSATNAGDTAATVVTAHNTSSTAHSDKFELKADIAPIATVTYNGNKEFVISSLDITTGVFTSTAHGLINNDKIFPTMNLMALDSFPLAVYPTGLAQRFYYIVNATTDTFRISLTSGGEAIASFSSLGTLSKWHFEKYVIDFFDVTGLTAMQEYRVIFEGRFAFQGTLYFYPPTWQSDEWQSGTTYSYPSMVGIGGGTVFSCLEAVLSNNPIGKMRYIGSCVSSNTAVANSRTDINTTYFSLRTDLPDITSIRIYCVNSCIANGMKVRVYTI